MAARRSPPWWRRIPAAYSRSIASNRILWPSQLDSVFSDVRIDTTKIGMLAETDIVEAVAERLARYRVANVVLDTVMLAKSGDPLLSASAVETLRQRLLPQVSLITPNLPEAAALLDAPPCA